MLLIACAERSTPQGEEVACTEADGLELYERRIEPVLFDDEPKSCNECHLSGIDLSLFVQQTPCQTLACMDERGLIDLGQPEDSMILSWIRRASPSSELITEEVIQGEYDAFLQWLEYAARCGNESCPDTYADPCNAEAPDASAPRCNVRDEVAAGFDAGGNRCDPLVLERLFQSRVYTWRGRCFPCHFAGDDRVQAPKWVYSGSETSPGSTEAACASGSLTSMRTVVRRGYIDLEEPERSLLLLKPLAEAAGGVVHGGHAKFRDREDPAYRDFAEWILSYAACAERDPTLPRPEEQPPLPPDSGVPESPIFDYCNCVLSSCHDEFHLKWGEDDAEAIAQCRTEALALPGAASDGGPRDTIDCRLSACNRSGTDRTACESALGAGQCAAP